MQQDNQDQQHQTSRSESSKGRHIPFLTTASSISAPFTVKPLISPKRETAMVGLAGSETQAANDNLAIVSSVSDAKRQKANIEEEEQNEYKKEISRLLDNNKRWVASITREHPNYFEELSKQQQPKYLWIGCSDSRVPANVITGTLPGDIFVHRNIANLVVHSDMNMLSVLSYAVDVLKVRHIIVCGHYGCGGVRAAMSNKQFGLIDNWLRHIKDVYMVHRAELEDIKDEEIRLRRMVELHAMEQVFDLCKTSIVQNAWKDTSRRLYIHGWVYDICDGIIRDLDVTFSSNEQLLGVYRFDV